MEFQPAPRGITRAQPQNDDVEEAGNVTIELADGSDNYLEDADARRDAEVNGTIYSTADLTISGSGSLQVTANYEDGVVTKDDFELLSGTVVVNAVDEGIRGRDSISISGGDAAITAGGDGPKTTNAESLDKGVIHITGGTLRIDAGDDGINAVAGEIATEVFIAVNGGVIDVTVGSGDTDAFDANGSIVITGGDIAVTASTSSFDYDGTAEMTGGTIVVNGEQMTSIPESRMGGGRGGNRRGG